MPHAIDLRSDTVTRPTPPMRAAIAEAEVGDDVFGDDAVFGEDPTVNELQREIAARLGKEAALFVPSGSMSNQIALRVHCRPGEEFLCESGCHIYNYEQGDGPDGEQHGAEHGDAQQRRAPQMKGLTTFSALGGL